MKKPMLRTIAFLLLFALGAGWIQPAPARAADEGGAGNMTLGLAAVIGVVIVIVAWQSDFSKDDEMITSTRDLRLTPRADEDLALVLTDWQAADADRGELISGVGLRAWF